MQIRISGKNLGELSLATFCPCCFWLKMRCGNKLPFQIFPGIFSSIDCYSKKITNLEFQRRGKIPRWFSDFGDLGEPIKIPHYTRFNIIDHETNILLTGVPDEAFRQSDGSLFIADYKTARCTGHQDHLLGMYITQLNAYAVIAEATGLGPVTGLGLIYYEPETEIGLDDIDSVCTDRGFAMQFLPKLLPVALEPGMVPPLLKRVREICDLTTAPEGLDGCDDCERLNTLVDVAARSPRLISAAP